jgi:hypothetical protein
MRLQEQLRGAFGEKGDLPLKGLSVHLGQTRTFADKSHRTLIT